MRRGARFCQKHGIKHFYDVGVLGILEKGEICLSTTNPNFVGCMGHPESFVYITSLALAAASTDKGVISEPV